VSGRLPLAKPAAAPSRPRIARRIPQRQTSRIPTDPRSITSIVGKMVRGTPHFRDARVVRRHDLTMTSGPVPPGPSGRLRSLRRTGANNGRPCPVGRGGTANLTAVETLPAVHLEHDQGGIRPHTDRNKAGPPRRPTAVAVAVWIQTARRIRGPGPTGRAATGPATRKPLAKPARCGPTSGKTPGLTRSGLTVGATPGLTRSGPTMGVAPGLTRSGLAPGLIRGGLTVGVTPALTLGPTMGVIPGPTRHGPTTRGDTRTGSGRADNVVTHAPPQQRTTMDESSLRPGHGRCPRHARRPFMGQQRPTAGLRLRRTFAFKASKRAG